MNFIRFQDGSFGYSDGRTGYGLGYIFDSKWYKFIDRCKGDYVLLSKVAFYLRQGVKFSPLYTCDLCKKTSVAMKVRPRSDCHAWNRDNKKDYGFIFLNTLCMSCWNRVRRDVVVKQQNVDELNKLINKLIKLCRYISMNKDVSVITNGISVIENCGDARKFILETMINIRDGKIPVNAGLAIAANTKVLNDNMQIEINAAKVKILSTAQGHNFGEISQMGKTLIG